MKELRVNTEIRIPRVRLISKDGIQLGIMSSFDARMLAEDDGLDLVEISPTANPPVCQIMDYGKWKYQKEKKEKELRSKQVVIKLKEIGFHPNISDHDYGYRLVQAKKFFSDGCKVKVNIQYRGREINHTDLGEALLEKFKKDLEGIAIVEESQFEGRNLYAIFRKA